MSNTRGRGQQTGQEIDQKKIDKKKKRALYILAGDSKEEHFLGADCPEPLSFIQFDFYSPILCSWLHRVKKKKKVI